VSFVKMKLDALDLDFKAIELLPEDEKQTRSMCVDFARKELGFLVGLIEKDDFSKLIKFPFPQGRASLHLREQVLRELENMQEITLGFNSNPEKSTNSKLIKLLRTRLKKLNETIETARIQASTKKNE